MNYCYTPSIYPPESLQLQGAQGSSKWYDGSYSCTLIIMSSLTERLHVFLRSTERYLKTDMVYLFHGSFWMTFAQVATSAASFFLSIAFANFVDPATYGIYRYVLTIAGILTIPTLTGLNTATVQAVAQGKDGVLRPNVRTKIIWGLLGGAASLLLAAYYYLSTPTSPLALTFFIAALFLPFMDSFGLYDAFLQGKKDFRRSSLYMIVAQLTATAVIALAVLLSHNLFLIVIAYFASWTIARYFLLQMTVRHYRPIDRADAQTLTYGKHLTLMSVLGTIASYADRLLVFHYLGATSLAVYSFALSPVDQIKGVFKGIPSLALPKLSALSSEQINERLTERLWMLTFAGAAVAALYIVCAPFLFMALFPKYLSAVLLTQVYAAGLAFVAPLQLIASALQSKPQMVRAMYASSTASNVVLILSLAVFGYYWGMFGIVLARVSQYLLSLIFGLIVWRWARTTS